MAESIAYCPISHRLLRGICEFGNFKSVSDVTASVESEPWNSSVVWLDVENGAGDIVRLLVSVELFAGAVLASTLAACIRYMFDAIYTEGPTGKLAARAMG